MEITGTSLARSPRMRERTASTVPSILLQPNGWWALLLFGFANGFSADSALNKASREQWTAEQRAAAKP